jgi:hypothetical protein
MPVVSGADTLRRSGDTATDGPDPAVAEAQGGNMADPQQATETEETPELAGAGSSDDILGFGLFPTRREGVLRGPVALTGALGAAVVIGAFLYLSDQNSDRWELRCTHDRVEPRKGLYFPWGTRRLSDDAHDLLALPEGMSCATTRFSSLVELDRSFADLLLDTAEQRMQQGNPEALAQARQDVERAHRLNGLAAEQRSRAVDLQADMAYHEAREILRQVERNLWQARHKLERARSLGAEQRIGDLEGWLQFVEGETERFRPALGPNDVPPGELVTQIPDAGAAPAVPSPDEEDTFL